MLRKVLKGELGFVDIWLHRLKKIKDLLTKQGLLYTIYYYYHSVSRMMFCLSVFGRKDITIFSDARLGGVEFMHIGKNFSSGRGLWLEAVKEYRTGEQFFSPQLIIGDRVNVGEYVHIGCNHKVVIGDDVLMGSKIYITDHNHGVYRGENADSPAIPPVNRRLTEGESVIIGARCWIGEFVTILPGVTIGEGSIIGSQSTVTHDIPANSIAVGSPARVIKLWDENTRQWIDV